MGFFIITENMMTIFCTVIYSLTVCAFLFCAVLRMLDLWKSQSRNVDEMYPARKLATVMYLLGAMQFPVVIHPASGDAWLLAQCFWVLYIPMAYSLGIKRFFFGDREYTQLRLWLVGGVPVAFLLGLFAIACLGGNVLAEMSTSILICATVIAVGLAVYQLRVSLWLRRLIINFNHDIYSSDENFPSKFATGITTVASLAIVIAWVVFLLGDRLWLTSFSLFITLIAVGVLVVILHPQRECASDKGKVEEMKTAARIEFTDGNAPTPTNEGSEQKQGKLSEQMLDQIEQRIREIVEGQQLYLNPELNRVSLDAMLGINHYYMSQAFALRFGSYYKYVNTLRLDYAAQYAASHPEAKTLEIAYAAGFGSVRSYQRIRKLQEIGELK